MHNTPRIPHRQCGGVDCSYTWSNHGVYINRHRAWVGWWGCKGLIVWAREKRVFHPPPPGALLMRSPPCPISDWCQWGLGSIPKVNKLTPATEWIVNCLPHGGSKWIEWMFGQLARGDTDHCQPEGTDADEAPNELTSSAKLALLRWKKPNKKTNNCRFYFSLAMLRHWIEMMTCSSVLSTIVFR